MKINWHVILGKAESLSLTALVAVAVSGAVTAMFDARLESSKEHAEAVLNQKYQFDSSQNNLFSQLGIYTNSLIDKEKAKKEGLQTAIVSAQLQVNNLENEIDDRNNPALIKYSKELENLDVQVRNVSSIADLKNVYETSQRLLSLHDKVSKSLDKNLKISIW